MIGAIGIQLGIEIKLRVNLFAIGFDFGRKQSRFRGGHQKIQGSAIFSFAKARKIPSLAKRQWLP
jgi:hypothetical protein